MTEQETNNYFKVDAKQITDMLFDTKMFREDITRDGMNAIEDYISFAMSSKYNLIKSAQKLSDTINKQKCQ